MRVVYGYVIIPALGYRVTVYLRYEVVFANKCSYHGPRAVLEVNAGPCGRLGGARRATSVVSAGPRRLLSSEDSLNMPTVKSGH